MVAFNFQKKFADAVESGAKLQTIRQKRRCKAGDAVQLYTCQRTKNSRKLRDAVCVAVDSVTLTKDGPFFGQPGWWPKDKNVFAERDGFKSYQEMWDWFFVTYQNEEIFNGYVYLFSAKSPDSKVQEGK
jgi:hypothetical protein